MRSNPEEYELVAPGSLEETIAILSGDRDSWTPMAGGTDLMVQYAAGQLTSRRFVSLWNVPELRGMSILAGEIRVGAACTYTDLRKSEIVQREFPLLARAAAWVGGIANQNRGTLGGNIVNASPAGDSLPALLAYDAELILASVRGERRIPYTGFHSDYKKTALAPDELIRSVCLPRRFSGYHSYARKVGTRNAQAISKVCIAALGRMAGAVVEDVRVAVGSVAPYPLRLPLTEGMLSGKRVEPSLVKSARNMAVSEIRPIDDIRSTARYRAAVAANLVAEFIEELADRSRPA
jgi:CO/xanthine dehydrogenase FAD-binding subunit